MRVCIVEMDVERSSNVAMKHVLLMKLGESRRRRLHRTMHD
jgi:hypothetical protein